MVDEVQKTNNSARNCGVMLPEPFTITIISRYKDFISFLHAKDFFFFFAAYALCIIKYFQGDERKEVELQDSSFSSLKLRFFNLYGRHSFLLVTK